MKMSNMVAVLAASGVVPHAFVPIDQHHDQRGETCRGRDRPDDVQRAHSDRSQAISHAAARIMAGMPQAISAPRTQTAPTPIVLNSQGFMGADGAACAACDVSGDQIPSGSRRRISSSTIRS